MTTIGPSWKPLQCVALVRVEGAALDRFARAAGQLDQEA